MPRSPWLLLSLAALAALGGCANSPHYDFWHPGNIQTQRLRAVVHDPYPDQDQGPVVMGGRPRDYAEPLPEAVRNRIYRDGYWGQ